MFLKLMNILKLVTNKLNEMYKYAILRLVVLTIIFTACVRNKSGVSTVNSTLPENSNIFEVSEVIQGNTYTYLKVKENSAERWVAVSKQEIKPGDVYYYGSGLLMNNFYSTEIDRSFDEIYFAGEISLTPISLDAASDYMPMHSGKVAVSENNSINLNKLSGELTIADIFANRNNYAGKEIEIKGVVVKVNESIMNRNWIHIQDGTNHNGEYSLTITSQDLVRINEVVTLRGKISLNKDFGAGYFYNVIVEDAYIVTN